MRTREDVRRWREEDIYNLAKRRCEEPTEEILADCRRIMNSLYRLAGLVDKLLDLDSDESKCNSKATQNLGKRRARWEERLDKYLEPYNAMIGQYWTYPDIVELNNKGYSLGLVHYYD